MIRSTADCNDRSSRVSIYRTTSIKMKDIETGLGFNDVVGSVRLTVNEAKHRRWLFVTFALVCSLAVVGLLSILSAVVHKICMPDKPHPMVYVQSRGQSTANIAPKIYSKKIQKHRTTAQGPGYEIKVAINLVHGREKDGVDEHFLGNSASRVNTVVTSRITTVSDRISA